MVPQISDFSSVADLRAPIGIVIRRGTAMKWMRIFTLSSLDILCLLSSWMLAERLGTPTASFWRFETHPYSLIPIISIIVGMMASRGLYASGDKRRDYFGLLKSVALGNVLFLLSGYFYDPQQFISRTHFLIFLTASLSTTCLSHLVVDKATKLLRKKGAIRYPVFLIADQAQQNKAKEIIEKEDRYNILGIASARALDRYERISTLTELKRLGITEAFVTWDSIKRRLFLSWYFQSSGITLRVIPIQDEPMFRGANLWMIGGLAALSFSPSTVTGIDFRIKRVLDFCLATIILTITFPLLVAIMIAVKLDSPGPIFYKQTRIGLHGKPFKVWKFRSMVVNADARQKELETLNKNRDGILFKIDNDPRITKVGRFLRDYSLDELPQIFNVLLGEMSLVGPRPLPKRDVDKFSPHHLVRHEVLPGITGLWQVSGRSDIDNFEHVLSLDLNYIEHWSLWMDFTILLRTVGVVLQKSGAY